jgi:anti-anti-sigma factor
VYNTQVLLLGELAGTPPRIELNPFKHHSLFDEDIAIPELSAEELKDARCREERPEAGGVLKIMGVAELTAAHGRRFQKQVRAALNGHTSVEIDLSHTTTMDCAGLGALIAIRNLARDRKGVVRLVNPGAGVQQLLELMRAGEVFELVKTSV